jgi:PAS domain S-box-containing protein
MTVSEWTRLIGICFADLFAIVAVIVYVRDKRKVILSALHIHRRVEERIEREIMSFDKAILPKIVTDEGGVISNVNTAAQVLLGWTESELFGKNISLIVHEGNKQKLAAMIDDFKGKEMKMRSSNETIVSKWKTEIQVEVVIKKEDISGNFVYLFVYRDRAKEIHNVKMFQQIIDIMKMKIDILSMGEELGKTGSWVWDLGEDEITVSDGYKKITGLDAKGPSKFKSYELATRVWKKDNEKVKAALDLALSGKPYDITYKQMRSSDFMLVTIHSIVKPILNDEGVPYVLYGNTMEMSAKPLKEDEEE